MVGYVAAGIRADHESTEIDEALQKASLGMMVQVRQGSSEHNLETFLPLLVEDRLGDWSLATDDILPTDIIEHGHINALLKRTVEAGVPPARASAPATARQPHSPEPTKSARSKSPKATAPAR